jgi:hypothetical protein
MNPTVTFALDRESLWLSESLTATLRVEAAAPLVVTVPKDVLLPESAAAWRVRPLGPATVAPLPGGRASWTLQLRLDPYVPGDAVPIAVAPLTVKASTANEVTFDLPAKAVKVQTAVRDPKAADVRTITGLIDPPPPPPAGGVPVPAAFGLVAAAVIVTAAVVARLRRKPPPVPTESPAERLEKLAARGNEVGGREFADELASIVRAHVEARFAIPATRRTTGELCDGEPLDRFKDVLAWCDGVKFSGREPTTDECAEMVAKGREMLESSR